MSATYRNLIIIVFASIINILSPQYAHAQLKHQGPSTSEKLAIKEGKKVLDSLRNNNTAYPYSQFDKRMKEALTEKQLAQVFLEIEKRCGKYQSSEKWKMVKNGIYAIVTAQINFKMISLQYLITFNTDDLIAGIYFKPLPKE